jgi:hypothetical protein
MVKEIEWSEQMEPRIYRLLMVLSPTERAAFFRELRKLYCLDCGLMLPPDGRCTCRR